MRDELGNIKKVMEIIDPISPTFCLAKWHHVTIYLQTGETHSCYHPSPHKVPLSELKGNPSALHNTLEKKKERRQMLQGKKPSGCSYCWKVEALGADYVSDRHIRTTSIYTKQRLKEITDSKWDININPEYVELSFGNECNFKCGYCHPKASSRLMQEIKQYGPYEKVKNHRQDIDWFTTYPEDNNPYVDAWWAWWPELRKSLNILRLTGGEPLMHKSTWKLMESLAAEPMPRLELNINSNLGGPEKWVIRLVNQVKGLLDTGSIRSFRLFSSIDTWGAKAEYLRTGLNLDQWEKNLDTYVVGTQSKVTLMITFNILSVTSFKALLEKILLWRKKYDEVIIGEGNKRKILFDTPHLKEPLQYDMNLLPKSQFMPYMCESLKFIEENLDDSDRTLFSTLEYEKFKRVVHYMEKTEYSEEKLDEGYRDFFNWFSEYDRRRGHVFTDIFPEYRDFYEQCHELVGSSV